MFKIEFYEPDLSDMVTLKDAQVDTLIEAKIIAIARIRKYLQSCEVTFRFHAGCMYEVFLRRKFVGFVKVVKV